MKLVELLSEERLLVPFKAKNLADAARQLARAIVSSGVVTNGEKLDEMLTEALPGDAVNVGPAFLLHLRADTVPRVVVAMGIAGKAIQREQEKSEKIKEARIVLLILAPPRETSAYLQTLSAFARALSDEAVVEDLLAAGSPKAVLESEALAGIELPGHLTVRDVMVQGGIAVRPETTLGEASHLMVDHDVHALPVVSEKDEVLGMVTHAELLRHLLPLYVKRMSSGKYKAMQKEGDEQVSDPHDMPVRDVMDRSVLCVSEDQVLADVATMMINRKIDRFPVVREGALVGFLTRGDIVRRLLGP